MNVLRTFVNGTFLKSFNTIFIENIKKLFKNLDVFFFFIKSF